MTRWVSPPRPEDVFCPRCYQRKPDYPGAMSKMTEAREIELCPACGVDESLRTAKGLPPIPMHDWPIDPSLRLTADGPIQRLPISRIVSGQDR